MHAADQVLVYLALAPAGSSFAVREVTGHARTTIWLLEQFLDARFTVAPEGALWRVRRD